MPKAWRVLQGLPLRSSLLPAVLATVCAALSALPMLAQGRPVEFADLMKMRRLGDLDISRDGRWILFDVTDTDLGNNRLISHLWLIAATGGRERPLTASLAGESQGRFSPDGTKILFMSTRSGTPQIYVAPFDPVNGSAGAALPLTHMPTGAEGAIWSPDGESVLFTSAVFPSCTGDAPAVEACNAQRQRDEEQDRDKARIFTHLLFRHWDRFTGEKRSHLFLIPAAGGTERDLMPGVEQDIPPFSLDEPAGYAFSPDSRQIAFEWIPGAAQALDTSRQIFTLNVGDPTSKPVRISTSMGGNFTPRYSPDGRYLAFRSQSRAGYESDRFRLMLYDRQSAQAREILPNFDRWVDDLAWAPDSRSIYFLSGVAGDEPVFETGIGGTEAGEAGAAGGGNEQKLRRLTTVGSYAGMHPVLHGDAILAARSTVQSPGEIYLLHLDREMADRANADARAVEETMPRGLHGPPPIGANLTPRSEVQLTHLNDALLAQLDLPPAETFWFEGARRTAVQGFLLRPPGFNAQQRYPVKFLIHGGPEGNWGDAWSYRWNPELFAASGYVVIMINPRGSTGYGQAFIDGVNGDWGGKPYVDLMRGLDYAEAKYPFIDNSRECALGASYGGYMADWILGHTDRFSCIVTHDGMFDAESFYGTTDELWFPEWEFGGTPWSKSGSGRGNGSLYRRWSPMLSAAKFKTPTLVIHGQLDYRLDVSQGLALFTTLQRLNVPSEMLYFPDEGHWVLKPQDSEIWNKTVSAWCDRYTKMRDSPTGESKTSEPRTSEPRTSESGQTAGAH